MVTVPSAPGALYFPSGAKGTRNPCLDQAKCGLDCGFVPSRFDSVRSLPADSFSALTPSREVTAFPIWSVPHE
jgi:hypothetical protein